MLSKHPLSGSVIGDPGTTLRETAKQTGLRIFRTGQLPYPFVDFYSALPTTLPEQASQGHGPMLEQEAG